MWVRRRVDDYPQDVPDFQYLGGFDYVEDANDHVRSFKWIMNFIVECKFKCILEDLVGDGR